MTRKTAFFEGWAWVKFNNLGLAPGTNLTFYISVANGFKLKVRKFQGLISTLAEVTGEKVVGGDHSAPVKPILNGPKGLSLILSLFTLFKILS